MVFQILNAPSHYDIVGFALIDQVMLNGLAVDTALGVSIRFLLEQLRVLIYQTLPQEL